MKNFIYENQGTNTYLVYTVTPDDMIDSMSLGMLTNNKIQGLAPALFTQMDTTRYIKYNVSSRVSVRQFFEGHVNKKRLIGVFSGIVDALLSAEDYMIDEQSILLDLDYIFADVSTCETVLICLPVVDLEAKATDIGMFFKNIMFSTQFDPTENCDHVAKIINYLNSTPVFSLNDFKTLLEGIKGEEKVEPAPFVQPPVQETPPRQVVPKTEVNPPQKLTPPQVVETPPQRVETVQGKTPEIPIPPVNNVPVMEKKEEPLANSEEKKMSMLYLLQHYSKENAALYKAQKEAEKGAKSDAKEKEKKKDKKKGKDIPQNQSFIVPGAPGSNVGFAIPGQPAPEPTPQPKMVEQVPPQQVATPKQVDPQYVPPQSVAPKQQVPPQQEIPQGRPHFGETVVLNEPKYGETTVLNIGTVTPEVKLKPYLIRIKNNERIELNKPVFRIGKEKSYVDYFISDNSVISRSHANIITREDEYFVVDTNSTNHTYINGMMIQSNVETKIQDGARIRFANEDFEFKLL